MALELADPSEAPSIESISPSVDAEIDLPRRLPDIIEEPNDLFEGLSRAELGEGRPVDRFSATVEDLPRPIGRPATPDAMYEDTDEATSSPRLAPPAFMPPNGEMSTTKPVDEFLPLRYHPPMDPRLGTIPRAYVPPSQGEHDVVVQWFPWWQKPLGSVSLLNSPTMPVHLQELMNLSLCNSPVVEAARTACDCGAAKSRVDSMLYQVAQGYWETYRLRGVVIVRERLYHDALEVRAQLKRLVGHQGKLTIVATAAARERLAHLAEAHAALCKAQNGLASVVSIPNWENEHELLPQDVPFTRPYRIDEAAELRNALSRRPEVQCAMRRVEAASFVMRGGPDMRANQAHALRRVHSTACVAPIHVHSFASPEIEEITDAVKLEVKNAIVRVASSYELMRRFSNAAQSSAKEVATLQSRCDAQTGSDVDMPLFFRSLLDAQSRLADAEQRYLTSEANYSAAILELRRANGTIIDHSTLAQGGPMRGPGISNPYALNAARTHGPRALEPAGKIFQAPQEPLTNNSAPGNGTGWQWMHKGRSSWKNPPTSSGRVHPSAELPMPQGALLLPGTSMSPAVSPAARPYSPPPPTVPPHGAQSGVEPFDFGDLGTESTLSPLTQATPSMSPYRHWTNGNNTADIPRGELPMPRGEHISP